jgi:hypothetical protein
MGGGASGNTPSDMSEEWEGEGKAAGPLWRACGDEGGRHTHKVVQLDPSLPPLEDRSQVELYEMLKEPVTQRAIGAFAVSKKNEYLLMCWAEIEEFKEEAIDTLRQEMVGEIHDAYVRPGSGMQIQGLPEEVARQMASCDHSKVGNSVFAEV